MKISLTNKKLGGSIPSVNLPVDKSCRKDVPFQKGCYAKKGHYKYETVITSMNNNWNEYKADAESYFNGIIDYLNNGLITYKFFRWHASGDIVDYKYLLGIIRVAAECPKTRFLCYTKKYSLVNMYLSLGHEIPKNLTIVFSEWIDFKADNPYYLPTTQVKRKKDPLPYPAFICPGSCSKCQKCWALKQGQTLFFNKH